MPYPLPILNNFDNTNNLDSEIDVILSEVNKKYGYDFRHYSHDSLIRRLESFKQSQGLNRLIDMLPEILLNKNYFESFLSKMTIGVTEFFRDPEFFKSLYTNVIPILKSFPYLKIWHAGCSTGEEVYSMAIILKEHDLLERCIIYGTDINNIALDHAKNSIYSLDSLSKAQSNFIKIIEEGNLSKYYYNSYNRVKLDKSLCSKITFSHHNLTRDEKFGEMNIIFCRNVMIYFDKELQRHVLTLLSKSLRYGGYLCLGRGESLFNSIIDKEFEVIDLRQRIYRKKFPEGVKR